MRNGLELYRKHAFSFCDLGLLQLAEVIFDSYFPKHQKNLRPGLLDRAETKGIRPLVCQEKNLPLFSAKLCRGRTCYFRISTLREQAAC